MGEPERSIFDELADVDAASEARRLAQAEADIAAGRLVPNAEVMAWLATWGTPEEKPAPASWLK